VAPSRLVVHKERVGVGGGRVGALRGLGRTASLGALGLDHLLALRLELVRAALNEQHAEDELLELGGIHRAAEDVSGAEQVALELGKGETTVGHGLLLNIGGGGA